MQTIADVLKNKIIERQEQTKKRGGNPNWIEAEQFGKYVRLSTPFVLKLFRVYGKGKVLGMQSFLRDIPNLDPSRYAGLVIWRLKGGQYKNH